MVPDETFLLRLAWHPAHFTDGVVNASAFPRNDLEGKDGRHLSVDREDNLSKAAIDHLILRQGKTENFTEAVFVRLLCESIRSAKNISDELAFAVLEDPIREALGSGPENLGHCGVANATKMKGRSYVDQLRVMLVQMSLDNRLYGDIFPQHQD